MGRRFFSSTAAFAAVAVVVLDSWEVPRHTAAAKSEIKLRLRQMHDALFFRFRQFITYINKKRE